jgi:hypothetical protein
MAHQSQAIEPVLVKDSYEQPEKACKFTSTKVKLAR